jgi:hypothetical protein
MWELECVRRSTRVGHLDTSNFHFDAATLAVLFVVGSFSGCSKRPPVIGRRYHQKHGPAQDYHLFGSGLTLVLRRPSAVAPSVA